MNRRDFLVGAGALVLAPGAFARRLGGTPVALVTADLEAHVVAVELPFGRILRRIGTPPGPRAIETVGDVAVVAHTEYGLVSFLDGETLRVREVLGGFSQPRYAVAARDRRHAFVTDSGSGELVVVDAQNARVAARVALGGAPRHLAYEPSGRLLWVVLGNVSNRIVSIDVTDPSRPRVVRRFAPPFGAHDVGFGPGRAWVTGGATRAVAVYGPSGRPITLGADAAPQHVTFVGELAFVTSGDSGTLRVHDARTGRLVRTTRVPFGSYNVQRTANNLVLMPSLTQGTLCVSNARGGLTLRRRVARSSHDACLVVRTR